MAVIPELIQAYVLHTRPYRNSSVIVELLTPSQGRVSVVARGVRGQRRNQGGILQPFVSLMISYRGHHELKKLFNFEALQVPLELNGTRLYCGLYLNEILMRLLPRDDAYPLLFQRYQQALKALVTTDCCESVLRRFEKQLLTELGYALPLTTDAVSGEALQENEYYYFKPGHGIMPVAKTQGTTTAVNVFHGKDLLAIANDTFTTEATLKAAKRLLRLALLPLLGNKPLKSRELFLKT